MLLFTLYGQEVHITLFFKDLFIYGGAGFSLWAFSSCGEWGLLFVVVRGVFLVLEHGLWVWAGLQ